MLTAVPGVGSSILVLFQTFVEFDHDIIYSVILLIQKKLLLVTCERMCTKDWFYRLVKLAQEKVWLDEMTISHDHSCWLRR